MRTDYHEEFASRYSRARSLDPDRRRIWAAALRDSIPADQVDVVMDLGAGIGRFLPVLREAWRPGLVVAVDRSEAMLRAAPDDPDAARIVADLDDLPFGGPGFDVCFCSMVVHYSRDPADLLARLHDLVRPGGAVCVRTATTRTLQSFEFLRCFPTALQAETRVMPSEEELHSWFSRSGLKEVRVEVVEVPQFGTRRELFRSVSARGFPSMQLISRREFHLGRLRFAVLLVVGWILRHPLRPEAAVLVVGRRPVQ